MKSFKISIIGSGPAGIIFYKSLIESGEFTPRDIQLIDINKSPCYQLGNYNVFVENYKSKCPEDLKFLVSNNITGTKIKKYFEEKYNFPIVNRQVSEISKTKNNKFKIIFNKGFIFSENVVLATGLSPKLLSKKIFDKNRNYYDYTFKKFDDFKNINFTDNDIVFIGSGDSVLFKSCRLADWIYSNNISYKASCIKVFIKGKFKEDCNSELYYTFMKYVKIGIIKIETDLWNISKIKTNKFGYVSKIISKNGLFCSNFKKGSFISIHTGNKINLPKIKRGIENNLVYIGDADLFKNKKTCTIYDAILNSRNKAEDFININKIKLIIKNLYFPTSNNINVKKYIMSFSKFTNSDHHFLIKVNNKEYFFLKKYSLSHLDKINREIYSKLIMDDKVNIPTIIKSINDDYYHIENQEIYVLYKYIISKNLKDCGISINQFLNILCSVEKKMMEVSHISSKYYCFNKHINDFEIKSVKLFKKIRTDLRPHSVRDLNYVDFIIKEVKKNKSSILKLKILSHLIHGDLLPQNLIKDKNGDVWVLDWEKSREYITSIDIIRSITFTIFNPLEKDLGLSVELFVKNICYCLQKINLTNEEILNMLDLYYFHLISNIDFLNRLYIERQDLNEKMAGEDFLVCKWFKKHKNIIQKKINKFMFTD